MQIIAMMVVAAVGEVKSGSRLTVDENTAVEVECSVAVSSVYTIDDSIQIKRKLF